MKNIRFKTDAFMFMDLPCCYFKKTEYIHNCFETAAKIQPSIHRDFCLVDKCNYSFLAGQVFNPINVYKGQKLIRLVARKTIPSISKIIPNIPVTVLVKYNTPKTIASTTLIIRSIFPMFFFMIFIFRF